MTQYKIPLKRDLIQLTSLFRNIITKVSVEIPPQLIVPNLFTNIFGTSVSDKKEENKSVKVSAAYLLITQLIFYQILSETQTDLPKIQTTHLNPDLLTKNFEKAQRITKNLFFKPNIAHLVDNNTFKNLEDSIKEIINLKPELLQYEALASIFNTLIPLSIRKPLGAYYSGSKAAELLSYFSITDPSVRVFDPACGSGALLVASYQRKRELTEIKRGDFTEADHKRFLSLDITGIDIMPFAIHLSAIHLALQAPSCEFYQNRLAIHDSILLNPNSKLCQCFNFMKNNNKKSELSQHLDLDLIDLVIMNPPFVRQENLRKIRPSYKDELQKSFGEYSSYINKKMNYYCYFLFLADKFLKSGGKIATVIPASFLRIDTTFKIRQWLLKKYNIQFIICQQDKPNFSEDTSFREVILIATKNGPTTDVEYIIIKDLEKTESFEQISDWKIRKIPFDELSADNLFLHIATMREPNLLRIWQSISKQKGLISIDFFLRSTGASLKRGIETSRGVKIQDVVINAEKSKYLRQTDIWIYENETETHVNSINRVSNQKIWVPKKCLIPHLRRMSGEKQLDISDKREYVIISPFSQFFDMDLNEKKQKSISKRSDNWKTYVKDRKTNLMIARRFDVCATGTSLFSFFSKDKRAPPGVMWSVTGLEDDDAKILCLFFNSTFNFLQIFLNRVETRGGWMQLHEYVLNDLMVPNISDWTVERRKAFYQLFEEIKEIEFPPIWQQLAMNISLSDIMYEDYELIRGQFPELDQVIDAQFMARKKLDTFIFKSLGIENQIGNEWQIRELYQNLLLEIAILKKMMS
ncbi:MAG: class I SAM-dependent DNA methyltransferase [Promethearchaeota archaeon]